MQYVNSRLAEVQSSATLQNAFDLSCLLQANWGFGYWMPDMSIQCFTGWHRKLAIILGTPLMTLTW